MDQWNISFHTFFQYKCVIQFPEHQMMVVVMMMYMKKLFSIFGNSVISFFLLRGDDADKSRKHEQLLASNMSMICEAVFP